MRRLDQPETNINSEKIPWEPLRGQKLNFAITQRLLVLKLDSLQPVTKGGSRPPACAVLRLSIPWSIPSFFFSLSTSCYVVMFSVAVCTIINFLGIYQNVGTLWRGSSRLEVSSWSTRMRSSKIAPDLLTVTACSPSV